MAAARKRSTSALVLVGRPCSPHRHFVSGKPQARGRPSHTRLHQNAPQKHSWPTHLTAIPIGRSSYGDTGPCTTRRGRQPPVDTHTRSALTRAAARHQIGASAAMKNGDRPMHDVWQRPPPGNRTTAHSARLQRAPPQRRQHPWRHNDRHHVPIVNDRGCVHLPRKAATDTCDSQRGGMAEEKDTSTPGSSPSEDSGLPRTL